MVAAVGGSLFGYDVGISGGVTSMDGFLEKFFPSVYRNKMHVHENNYCKYNSQSLAAFTSSLYLAGLVASLVASPVTRKYGRRASIISGGLCFLIGAALDASSVNLTMLIFGRIMLGFGIGFGNQAVPMYLSEMAPTHLRGGLNMMFQLATTLGIFTANMINYGTEKIKPNGWRISLGLAAWPALLMTAGGILLPETPNSLVERGSPEKGRQVLEKLRGTTNVGAELQDIIEASELAKSIKSPFRNMLERKNRPQLIMAVFMPAFQILTGINAILFYAPVLFQTMGFGSKASLYSSALTGGVLAASTFISIATVDSWGRRALLIAGGVQMVICQSFLSLLCAFKYGIFVFFAGWVAAMTLFVCLFLPETKGVPIEETIFLWRKHWFWKKIIPA
nr:sugar carrier protein A-like [Ipomoea trifida]